VFIAHAEMFEYDQYHIIITVANSVSERYEKKWLQVLFCILIIDKGIHCAILQRLRVVDIFVQE
jgi:hypothetical protein